MLPSNNNKNRKKTSIEDEVREILEKKGRAGWLRMAECEKAYTANIREGENKGTRRTRFYRWRTQIDKGKVKGFQILTFQNNISYIGLESANPSVPGSLIAKDEKQVRKTLSFKEFLIYSCFKKLEEIGILNTRNSRNAMLEMRSLIMTLPKNLRKELMPSYLKAEKSLWQRWNKEVIGFRPVLTGAAEVDFMIGEVATLLHRQVSGWKK